MPAKPKQPVDGLIKDPRQIRALISPVRQEIADAIHAAGPVSISQLAAILGRPADALYFHIRTLERVGLLKRTGELATGRRSGAVYDVSDRPLRIRYDPQDRPVTRALIKVSGSMLRLAHRDFVRAFKDGLVDPEGDHRNTWSGRAKGWLTREEIAQVNLCWRKILEILQDARPREGARLHAATFVMSPVQQNARAKPPAHSGKPGKKRSKAPARPSTRKESP